MDQPLACMDVGCGDAWFLGALYQQLPPGSTAVGLDTALDADAIATLAAQAPKGVSLMREEPESVFDLLCLMDVCEHVENDVAFLRGLVDRRLRPGGWVVFCVPAWPSLYGAHDRALRHHRRYTPRAARALLTSAGLKVMTSGGLFHSLLVPRALQVARERTVKPKAIPEAIGIGAWTAPAAVTYGVNLALGVDGFLSRLSAALRLEVPGLSWWAICQKQS
jgi:SAM-dependent methyltransferase